MEQKWWTLITVCVGIFMLLIDITVVNVAPPQIQRSLIQLQRSSVGGQRLRADARGAAADRRLDRRFVGRKRVFAIGLILLTAASLAAGLGHRADLERARAVQGIGGAIMLATSLALIAQAFRGRDRGTAFAAYGAVIGAAVAVGLLVGGALTSGIAMPR